MWQFANLAQWLFLFGKAVKIDDDMDIEVGVLDGTCGCRY
jgi:hypothetical protein